MTLSYLHNLQAQLLLTRSCNQPDETIIERMEHVIASSGSEETTVDEFFDLYKESEAALFARTTDPLMTLHGYDIRQARLQARLAQLRSMWTLSESHRYVEKPRIENAMADVKAAIAAIASGSLNNRQTERLENMAGRCYEDARQSLVAALAQQIADKEAKALAAAAVIDSHKTARDAAALRIQDASWTTIDQGDGSHNAFRYRELITWVRPMNATTNNLTSTLGGDIGYIDGAVLADCALNWINTVKNQDLFELEDPSVYEMVNDIADGMFDPNKAAAGLLPVGRRTFAEFWSLGIWVPDTNNYISTDHAPRYDPTNWNRDIADTNSQLRHELLAENPDHQLIVSLAAQWLDLEQIAAGTLRINNPDISEQMKAVSLGALDSAFKPTATEIEEES